MRRSVAKLFYAVFSRKSPAAVASRVPSRRRRSGCAPLHRAPVLDLQRQVLSLQPAIARQCHQHHRWISSDYNECVSLGRDGCNYAAFHGVLVLQSPGDAGPAGHDGSASVKIRLWPGSVRIQTSTTHSKTHRAKTAPPHARLSQLAAPVCRAASAPPPRPPEVEGRTRDDLRITRKPRAIGDGQPQPPAPPAAPYTKQEGSHERALVLPPAHRTRPPARGWRLARTEARHRAAEARNGHDQGHVGPRTNEPPESRRRPENAKGDAPEADGLVG